MRITTKCCGSHPRIVGGLSSPRRHIPVWSRSRRALAAAAGGSDRGVFRGGFSAKKPAD